jgi:hypothetical protein
MKLTLWVLFILLPTLINDSFIFIFVFIQLLLLSLTANHTTILFVLTLVLLWFNFLAISSYFKWFLKLRERIVKYFSRRACLHFIGNAAGSKMAKFLAANSTKIIGGVTMSAFTIAVPLNDASTLGYRAGEDARETYKLNHPKASPQELQKINDVAFHKSLNANPLASFFHKVSGGIICAPTPVDRNGIHYTDPYNVDQASEARIKSTTPNSGAKNFVGLQHEDSKKTSFLQDTIPLEKLILI